MYPRKTRPREKPSKSLLEKICIMNPEYNHRPRLNLQTPDPDLTWTKPQAQIYKAKTQTVPNSALDPEWSLPEWQNDNDTMSEETLLIDLQIQ